MVKYEGKHLYVYIGVNGFIITLDFDFRGKARCIEFALFWCSIDLEELGL